MNSTIARLAFAALAGSRRKWLLIAFPLGLVALTVLTRVLSGEADAAGSVVIGVGFMLALPLLALLSATAVMGPEVDDGSIVYLLSKPVSRHVVAISKYVVAAATTLVLGVVPIFVLGVLLGGEDVQFWLSVVVGGVICALAYSGLFLALSTVWRHAVVASLIFVLVWEGVMSQIFSGIAVLSIQQWGIRVAEAVDGDVSTSDVPLAWALLAALVVTLGGVWFSGDRLRSFQLRGDE